MSFSEDFRRIQREISRLASDMERFLESFEPWVRPVIRGRERSIKEPLVDVYEAEDKYLVIVEIPGVPKDKLILNASEDMLEIRGEVRPVDVKGARLISKEIIHRAYNRTIRLPDKIKPEETKARYQDGILVVELPKAEVPKKVSIKIE
ncbi:MAG: Hsp20/alpha crystallin family protein [Thermoprotei archaeon]|nr:Hsp20/alpha crystallin family protein [Thermoprotei archaeon]